MRVSSTSCRIIFFAMFVSAQLIVMHYSSFLISMLSVSNNILPFKNLEELHRTGDYQLGIWKGSFTEDTFRVGSFCFDIERMVICCCKLYITYMVDSHTTS